jgi:hypothetical protein
MGLKPFYGLKPMEEKFFGAANAGAPPLARFAAGRFFK